MHNKSFIIGN